MSEELILTSALFGAEDKDDVRRRVRFLDEVEDIAGDVEALCSAQGTRGEYCLMSVCLNLIVFLSCANIPSAA